jgi:uncharacterized protein YdeI (YjbR/CyaY-like superfamily)
MTLPDDVRDALAGDVAARRRFESLPPSHQREYLAWIEQAKRPETRQRRIAGTVARLLNERATAD